MSLRKCPSCGNEFDLETDQCPNCGAPLEKATGNLPMIIGAVIIIFAILYYFYLS